MRTCFGLASLAVLLMIPVVVQAQPAPTTPAREAPTRIGPFEITSPSGDSRLGVGFSTQLRATAEDHALSAEERELRAKLELRRVRLLLRGSFFDSTLRVGFQLSVAPSSLELMDAWADYKFHRHIQVRLGQFKIHSSRYRQQSFSTVVLVDWATVASRFGSERQLGLMVHNGGWDNSDWTYSFGVFTGSNARASFENGIAREYDASLPNPSNLRDPAPLGDLHPEIVLGVGHSSDDIGARSNTDAHRGALRHLVDLGVAWDVAPEQGRDFALRLSPELLLKAHGFSFNLVGHIGLFEPAGGGMDLAMFGVISEVAYRFNEQWEIAARYGLVSYSQALRDDAHGHVESLVAAADPDDRDAIRADSSAIGELAAEHEIGGGLNVYIIGHQLKWHSDIGVLLTELGSETLRDVRVRSELQLAF